jgi:hypothetical protein
MPERDHRVHLHGAPHGDLARQQREKGELSSRCSSRDLWNDRRSQGTIRLLPEGYSAVCRISATASASFPHVRISLSSCFRPLGVSE